MSRRPRTSTGRSKCGENKSQRLDELVFAVRSRTVRRNFDQRNHSLIQVSIESGGAKSLALLRHGRQLELVTLLWNVIGVVILAVAAIGARSIALAGFGLDSVIEIGASTVVLWELAEVARSRRHAAMRLIGVAFIALSIYLAVQSTIILAIGFRSHHSPLGIGWTAGTAFVMFLLAYGKARVGAAMNNPVLTAEGRVTMIDGILASAVVLGLALNALFNWWWADPVAGYVILYYAIREGRSSLQHSATE